MSSGYTGRGGRGGGKKTSGKEKLQLSACDVSSDEFKKAWLNLKDLHDKELRRLQGKLNSLRKERLADGRWTGSIATIKRMTEQQKALNDTIQNLREQLNTKICTRCSMSDTYKNKLQKEFYDIQQQNLKFISELTEERNKLRDENRKLSSSLKSNQQHQEQQQRLHYYDDSDSDFYIHCSPKIPISNQSKDSLPAAQGNTSSQVTKSSETQTVKSRGRKASQQSSKYSIPLYSQDLFDMLEDSPKKKSPSNDSKPSAGGSDDQKSPVLFPLLAELTSPSPKEQGPKHDSLLSEDIFGQPKRKQILTQKTTTKNREIPRMDSFSYGFSKAPDGPQTSHSISKTSRETVHTYRKAFPCFARRKEKLPSTFLPMDHSLGSKEKESSSVAGNKAVPTLGDERTLTMSSRKSPFKDIDEPSSAGYVADRSQDDTQSVIFGSTIKRKARVKSGKWGK